MKRMINFIELRTLQVIRNMIKQSEVFNERDKEKPCRLRVVGEATGKDFEEWYKENHKEEQGKKAA